MANKNKYMVIVEGTEMVVDTVGEVNKLINGKRVTKQQVEAGEVEGVTVISEEEVSQLNLEDVAEASDNVEIIMVGEAPKRQATEEVEEDTVEEEEATEEAEDATPAVEEVDEDNEPDTEEVSDEEFEESQRTEPVQDEEVIPGSVESTKVTGKLADLVSKLKQPEPKDKTPKVKQDLAGQDVEYPDSFESVDAIKKFISRLSTDQLIEWAELEGVLDNAKPNDNASIYRMRVAVAVREKFFPSQRSSSPKKKSKYADYSTEQLLEMALENDIEVKDAKGDQRILRMYLIMALRNAEVLD